MMNQTESAPNRNAFATALALQQEHGRAYAALADQIRAQSPAAASVLLTMRQRQEAQLRQLMCIYGFSSRKDLGAALDSGAKSRQNEASGVKDLSKQPEHDPELRRKMFVLQIVQPGLAGLMDGSVSTLAPVFAAAFAIHNLSPLAPRERSFLARHETDRTLKPEPRRANSCRKSCETLFKPSWT